MKNTNLFRLAFLLFAGLSIFLSSCQPKEEGDKKYVIGFSQCTSDSWREAVLLEMQIEASNYRNVELVVYNAMDNSSRQVSQIRKLISQNVDVLIISPNEAVPITDVAVEAYRKGIPTIIHDRKIQSDEYTVSIGANNYNIGSAIGEYINGQLPTNSKILEIWGLEGSSPAMERHDGFIDHLRSDKNFQVTQVFGKWHYNSAYDAVNRLATFADIDLVYAHNDVMALAARDVIMKRDSVSGKRIRFIGIDGVYGDGAGLQAVADEKLEASFQYPTGGAISIQVAMQIINGEKVKKNYVLNTAIINRGNAKTILAQSEQLNHYQKRINRQKQEEDNLLSRFKFLRNSTILILALMLLIIPLLGYVMYMNLRVKNKNKELHDENQLVEAQKEELAVKNSQIENISNQKLQFFTNISHEIRTPLTLILGPVNKLIKNSKLDPSIQEDVALMKRNVDRLYRIVNQILDFRRIDNDKMKLILRQVDLIGMVREVFDYFTGIAEEKQIHYRFSTNIDELNIYIDVNKIEQVLVNIISNAFKYSDSGGDISVRITGEAETVLLEVEDHGRGISKESMEHLFERFYTGNKTFGTVGFGIGLNLSKEYVDLHDGEIRAESQPGEYTLFSVRLYKDITHYTHEYILEEPDRFNLSYHDMEVDTTVVNEMLSKTYDYHVLVVEDDPDVRYSLRKELSANFQVEVAGNGNEALDLLGQGDAFHLILSDVLMPGMNGFQLVNRVKNDLAFSHIPIILLTALSEDSQRIYGIAEGADEYIPKPFNIDFLKIRIINMISERQKMKEAYMKNLRAGTMDNVEVCKLMKVDELFRDKLLSIVDTQYENSDFSIEDLSEHLGLSRVHLYRKMKTLFGVSPTDYLRNYRLNKAMLLLKARQYNISEIAYMTGFTSPAYFTKCFRTLYGVTPTEAMVAN